MRKSVVIETLIFLIAFLVLRKRKKKDYVDIASKCEDYLVYFPYLLELIPLFSAIISTRFAETLSFVLELSPFILECFWWGRKKSW